MLNAGAERGELATRGRPRHDEEKPLTITDLGIDENQSKRWKGLANMSEAHFETAIATAKDTAGQVTTAFMLREAQKAKPQGRAPTGPKADAIREELKAAKERGELATQGGDRKSETKSTPATLIDIGGRPGESARWQGSPTRPAAVGPRIARAGAAIQA